MASPASRAQRELAFEYAVNEKIALELAFAASLAGARSICAMKHLGLMVAGDPLSTIPYIGVVGGMVIVSAGDPSLPHQSERGRTSATSDRCCTCPSSTRALPPRRSR